MKKRLTRRQVVAGFTASGAGLLLTAPALAHPGRGLGHWRKWDNDDWWEKLLEEVRNNSNKHEDEEEEPEQEEPEEPEEPEEDDEPEEEPDEDEEENTEDDSSEDEEEQEEPAEEEPSTEPIASLTQSDPIETSEDGQVIEGLEITASGDTAAIEVNHSNVTIRNCKIRHETGRGIHGRSDCSGMLIEDCDIECTGAPEAGPNPNEGMRNIDIEPSGRASDIVIRRVRLTRGSTGVHAYRCDDILVEFVEGYDFRGPFPRGQVVQFNNCESPVLQDFSCINQGDTSWCEDNVNCFETNDAIIRRGFIHGNNAPSGIGVLLEWGYGGLVEDVDCVYWSNGAFSAASEQDDITFRRCRARDGIAPESESDNIGEEAYDGSTIPSYEDWVGDLDLDGPSSGAEAFMAWDNGGGIRYEECVVYNFPNQPYWFNNSDGISTSDIETQEFMPREPISLTFGWES